MHSLSFKTILKISTCLFLLTTSCTNLDQEVVGELTPDNFFQTEEEVRTAIGPAYTALYNYMGQTSLWATQEITSDEMVLPLRAGAREDREHWVRLHQHTWTLEDPTVLNTWNFLFNGVFTCNRLIFELEELNRPITQPFIGELRAMRAIYYLWLLDVYGNVPIITFYANGSVFPRTSNRKTVFNFVESELLLNLNRVSNQVDATTYGKVNKMTIHAALAHLYLNAEVYSDNIRWAEAVAACDAIINAGHYELERDYFTNFNVENAASAEFIFAIPYDATFANGLNIAVQTLHPANQETYHLATSPQNECCTLEAFYNAYEDQDLRKGQASTEQGPFTGRGNFLVGPQWDITGERRLIDTISTISETDPDGAPVTLRPNINELFPAAWREAGARIGKYEIEIEGQPNMNNDLPIYRYADILLIKAEALWRQNPNNPESLALVNRIRTRAGLPPFTELTAANLLAERGRELFAELKRRTDLIRFGQFSKSWWEKPLSEEYRTLFPIPTSQIEMNPNLRQNPGY